MPVTANPVRRSSAHVAAPIAPRHPVTTAVLACMRLPVAPPPSGGCGRTLQPTPARVHVDHQKSQYMEHILGVYISEIGGKLRNCNERGRTIRNACQHMVLALQLAPENI